MRTTSLLALLPLCATSLALAQGPTCTFTPFGSPCGGTLRGTQVTSPTGATGVRLDVARAAPGTMAVLVLGPRVRPVSLPGSICPLLVDPRVVHFEKVDRAGNASFRFPMPATLPASADMQVVIVHAARGGRTADSTNGLNVLCQ